MKTLNLFSAIFLLLFFSGCKKSGGDSLTSGTTTTTTTAGVTAPDIYITGQESISSTSTKAKYWKNGMGVSLPFLPNGVASNSRGIAKLGSDIYICGTTQTTNSSLATFWKNGVAVLLSSQLSGTNDIFISGYDVYIAGYEDVGTSHTAVYWKNGNKVILPNGTKAYSIFVAGADVYVSGVKNYTVAGVNTNEIKYWKNGSEVILGTGDFASIPKSIIVNGNDVYVSGSTYNYIDYKALYWKNNSPIVLATSAYDAIVRDATFSNNTLYVSGAVASGTGTYIAKLWVNNIEQTLSGVTGSCYADAVCTYGNDIYVAGGNDTIRCWKNGAMTTILNGSLHAYAEDILVSP